ncbi:MAG: glycosyltransferase family 1 protein [Gemmatimonadota bacterium]
MPVSELRVALFTDTYAPQMNGVARTLARVAGAIRQRGGAVRVFTTTDPRAPASSDVVRYPSIACPLYGELRLAAPHAATIAHELARFRPSIVHIATPFGVGLAARSAARRLGLPCVTSYHTSFAAYARYYGLGPLHGAAWRYLRWFHNSGLRTLAPTHAVQTELESHGFERVSVWGRGVDRTRFTSAKRSRVMRLRVGANDGDLIVAYVGRIAKEKGLEDMLEAAGELHHSNRRIVFAFAGDGPFLDECRRRAPANCFFAGRLEGDDVAMFFASADMFVFPSTTDTFGNVLIEAMASALPVLAADTVSSREVLGDAGEFYVAGKGHALARLIHANAGDPHGRRHLAAASLRRAADFDWDVVTEQLIAVYECVRYPATASLAGVRRYRTATSLCC